MRGCGCILVLAVSCCFLIACGSSQTSLEAQYNSELTNVLSTISFGGKTSSDLTAIPPSKNELTQEQLDMYVWVRARAMQLAIQQKQLSQQSTNELLVTKTTKDPIDISHAALPAILGEHQPVSAEERQALNELKCSEVLYLWVKDIVAVTEEFLDSVGNPQIIDLVTEHDPAIKHNISLVKDVADRLAIVNRYPIEKFRAAAQQGNT